MIKWFDNSGDITGFAYYPTSQIFFGIFFMLISLLVPILFIYYNSQNLRFHLPEILFCVLFFIFFSYLGGHLAFQSLSANIKSEELSLYQDMRRPPTVLSIKLSELKSIETMPRTEANYDYYVLYIVTSNYTKEFFKSTSKNEVNTISSAITTLIKTKQGDSDEAPTFEQ